MDEDKEKIYWLVGSDYDVYYNKAIYFRCMGLGKFIDSIEKGSTIKAITVDGNNIGFILADNK